MYEDEDEDEGRHKRRRRSSKNERGGDDQRAPVHVVLPGAHCGLFGLHSRGARVLVCIELCAGVVGRARERRGCKHGRRWSRCSSMTRLC
jgi:hypothetical protein